MLCSIEGTQDVMRISASASTRRMLSMEIGVAATTKVREHYLSNGGEL